MAHRCRDNDINASSMPLRRARFSLPGKSGSVAGGRTLLYSIIHDVTERRRAETALQQSESDDLWAMLIEEMISQAGAHGITVHLRGDRRHIQDQVLVGEVPPATASRSRR